MGNTDKQKRAPRPDGGSVAVAEKTPAAVEGLALHPLIRQLDLTSLRLFLVVTQVGSMAQAAHVAAIAPSALSRRMRELEDTLGVTLLVRTTEGIRLTEAGQLVQEYAARQLGALHEMVTRLKQFGPDKQDAITVVINQSSLDPEFCRHLAEFSRKHHHIDVSIEGRKSTEIRDALLSGYADLAIGNEWYLDQDGLTCYQYRQDRFVVIDGRPERSGVRAPVKFQHVLQQPLIGLSKGSAYNRWLEGRAASLGVRLQFGTCVSNFQALCQLASVGLGVGIVPEPLLSTMSGMDDIAAMPLDETWAYKKVMICHRSGQALSPASRAALEFFQGRAMRQDHAGG